MSYLLPRSLKGRTQPRRSYRANGVVYAAVDLGTNNCRMLMAVPDGQGFRVVDSFSRPVRLGQGLGSTGRLNDEAMNRTIEALRVCANKMRSVGCERVRAVATEACRRAVNGESFLARVESATGISLTAISPEEEATLTVAGCAPLLDGTAPYALIFDIGGGSTEIMWVRQMADRCPELIDLLSIPVGVVTLAEEYGFGPIHQRQQMQIVRQIDAILAPFCTRNGINAQLAAGRLQMLGTSGTVTALGAIHLGLPRYNRPQVDGLWLELDRIQAISERLTQMDLADRARIPSIGQSRADLVAVGCTILDAICWRWPAPRVRVADRGIREGLLQAMIAADRPGPPPVPL